MIAFLFPGQGSQYIGMGADFCAEFAVARRTFEEASDALGVDVANLCFEGEAATLALTANAQPAILTTSVAALRVVLEETEIRPDLVAGHSLGEFTALVASECLSFSDAVRTVRKRGEFMQEAVPAGVGKMAAVLGLTSASFAPRLRGKRPWFPRPISIHPPRPLSPEKPGPSRPRRSLRRKKGQDGLSSSR